MAYDDLLFPEQERQFILEETLGSLGVPVDFLTSRASLMVEEIPLGSLSVPVDSLYESSELCYETPEPPNSYAL